MYMYLRQHPDIFMPWKKEPLYFGKDLEYKHPRISEKEYLDYFKNAEREKRVGEATATYLYSREAAKEIYQFNPEARIIIMLRNPVDMLYSYHRLHVFLGNEDILEFEEALRAEIDRKNGKRIPRNADCHHYFYYSEKIRYAEQVGRYLKAFGPKKVHIILFEDFVRNMSKVYRKTLEFLGVDPDFQPSLEIFNLSRHTRYRIFRRMIKSHILTRIARAYIPEALRIRLYRFLAKINTRTSPPLPMSEDLKRRLQSELKGEIESLAELLGRDLALWM